MIWQRLKQFFRPGFTTQPPTPVPKIQPPQCEHSEPNEVFDYGDKDGYRYICTKCRKEVGTYYDGKRKIWHKYEVPQPQAPTLKT